MKNEPSAANRTVAAAVDPVQKRHMKRSTGPWVAALVAACGDDLAPRPGEADAGGRAPDAMAAVCQVSENRRALMEELVHKSLMDLVHTTSETHGPQDRGFASQLVGVNQGYIGHLTLFEVCSGPSSFDPYCEYAGSPEPADDPFYDDHDKCMRLGCEADGVGTSTMYWTMRPEEDPGERHTFSYQTTSPAGEAVADPNPFHVWRYDFTETDTVTVTSEIDRSLVITPTGGDAIDLDDTGTLTATKVDDEITGVSLDLAFPAFLSGGATTVEISLDGEGLSTGSVRQGEQTIAEVTGAFAFDAPLVFAWCPDV